MWPDDNGIIPEHKKMNLLINQPIILIVNPSLYNGKKTGTINKAIRVYV
jgi:hypothetical protein